MGGIESLEELSDAIRSVRKAVDQIEYSDDAAFAERRDAAKAACERAGLPWDGGVGVEAERLPKWGSLPDDRDLFLVLSQDGDCYLVGDAGSAQAMLIGREEWESECEAAFVDMVNRLWDHGRHDAHEAWRERVGADSPGPGR